MKRAALPGNTKARDNLEATNLLSSKPPDPEDQEDLARETTSKPQMMTKQPEDDLVSYNLTQSQLAFNDTRMSFLPGNTFDLTKTKNSMLLGSSKAGKTLG